MPVDRDALILESWDRSDDAARRAAAAAVASAVGGEVVDVELDCQGDQRHTVAVVEVRGVRMVLVPGGTVSLGWDPSRPLGLTAAQQASVDAEPDATVPFAEMLGYYFAPLRTVTLDPFLLEIEPHSIADWVGQLEGDDLLAAVEARVLAEGFRLPSDDEWEHAVHGGSTTLFRWGDVWPDGIPMPRESHFTGHLVPTAFGLHLLADPYQVEVVTAPLGFRGGDGGSSVCGGRAAPEPWMTFASAFRWPRELWEDAVPESLEQGWIRRALSIP